MPHNLTRNPRLRDADGVRLQICYPSPSSQTLFAPPAAQPLCSRRSRGVTVLDTLDASQSSATGGAAENLLAGGCGVASRVDQSLFAWRRLVRLAVLQQAFPTVAEDTPPREPRSNLYKGIARDASMPEISVVKHPLSAEFTAPGCNKMCETSASNHEFGIQRRVWPGDEYRTVVNHSGWKLRWSLVIGYRESRHCRCQTFARVHVPIDANFVC